MINKAVLVVAMPGEYLSMIEYIQTHVAILNDKTKRNSDNPTIWEVVVETDGGLANVYVDENDGSIGAIIFIGERWRMMAEDKKATLVRNQLPTRVALIVPPKHVENEGVITIYYQHADCDNFVSAILSS